MSHEDRRGEQILIMAAMAGQGWLTAREISDRAFGKARPGVAPNSSLFSLNAASLMQRGEIERSAERGPAGYPTYRLVPSRGPAAELDCPQETHPEEETPAR